MLSGLLEFYGFLLRDQKLNRNIVNLKITLTDVCWYNGEKFDFLKLSFEFRSREGENRKSHSYQRFIK